MVMKACATLIGETIRSTPMAVRVVVAVMAGLLSVLLLLRALLRGRRAGAGAAHGDKRFAEELIRYMEMDDGFDRRLGLSRHGKVLSVRSNGGIIAMEYTIPQEACMGGAAAGGGGGGGSSSSSTSSTSGGGQQVGVGFVLALADLLTSLALILSDADHRPGVSVSLTGELFDNLCAGQTVVLRAAVSKVGANLGFTEMRVLNGSGELVARVKHIKYLNMGAIWSFVGFLMPLVVRLQLRLQGRPTAATAAAASASASKQSQKGETPSASEARGSSDSFDKLFSQSVQMVRPATTTGGGESDASTGAAAAPSLRPSHVTAHSFTGTPAVRNKFGFIHGGAISCAIEKCIMDHIRDSRSAAKDALRPSPSLLPALHFLEVSFLSPCRGSLLVDVETHSLYASGKPPAAASSREGSAQQLLGVSPLLPRGSISVTVRQPKKNKPLVEAVVSF